MIIEIIVFNMFPQLQILNQQSIIILINILLNLI